MDSGWRIAKFLGSLSSSNELLYAISLYLDLKFLYSLARVLAPSADIPKSIRAR